VILLTGSVGRSIGPRWTASIAATSSLAHFYHEVDVWLFTGIYEVVQRHEDRYEVQLLELAAPFIGRLKLRSSYKERAVRVNLEGVYDGFEVSEILAEPFAGRAFTRYEDIHLLIATQ